ncbi:uncharacterized protein DUF998 [Isoptericola sp. CG 20/1183]|uniref:Uncharacterized protein DUF998 n=1 Tax=Isoptericola halotolerans TaxID=300560 RepID=A0ABX5EEW8_9MICO|nr:MULTISPECIES: DUF998 domain-containing protein [Isoptericola]PRZ07686.1 uncharacterized protein DUF998 [Isoptericola halotolerans]PRZ07955.1 uncharacterized protein DUF998 [Isoptericola sp. CG 20/1183]
MMPMLWVAAVCCWSFVVVFLVDGWTRPGYAWVRQPVSALALGRRGWVQTTSFLVCGTAVAAGALVGREALGSGLLAVVVGVFGLALVASGVFPMDPMRGYPPGTPDTTPEETSWRHRLHDHAGVVAFAAVPLAALAAAFALPEVWWKVYSGTTAALAGGGLLAFGQAWEEDSRRAGLLQKATIAVGWLWVGLLFVRAA